MEGASSWQEARIKELEGKLKQYEKSLALAFKLIHLWQNEFKDVVSFLSNMPLIEIDEELKRQRQVTIQADLLLQEWKNEIKEVSVFMETYVDVFDYLTMSHKELKASIECSKNSSETSCFPHEELAAYRLFLSRFEAVLKRTSYDMENNLILPTQRRLFHIDVENTSCSSDDDILKNTSEQEGFYVDGLYRPFFDKSSNKYVISEGEHAHNSLSVQHVPHLCSTFDAQKPEPLIPIRKVGLQDESISSNSEPLSFREQCLSLENSVMTLENQLKTVEDVMKDFKSAIIPATLRCQGTNDAIRNDSLYDTYNDSLRSEGFTEVSPFVKFPLD